MTIMVEADAALSRAVIVAGREAIEDEEVREMVLPLPVPLLTDTPRADCPCCSGAPPCSCPCSRSRG